MKTAIYCRTSTEDQGISMKDQEERLRAYCVSRGDWSVVKVYRDEASGKSLNRPALAQLLEDAKAHRLDSLVILKLDRLTRSVRDLGNLIEFFEKQKVTWVSLTEAIDASSAAGRLMIHVLGSVAEWERGIIRERTSSALRFKKNHMQVYGHIPLGFARVGDSLAPEEKEMLTVRMIYHLRGQGLTLRAIAARLNKIHARTKKGGRWAPATVLTILNNKIYAPYLATQD